MLSNAIVESSKKQSAINSIVVNFMKTFNVIADPQNIENIEINNWSEIISNSNPNDLEIFQTAMRKLMEYSWLDRGKDNSDGPQENDKTDVENEYAKERLEWDEQRKIEEEHNCVQEQDKKPYDLTAQDILGVLVEALPTSYIGFPCETGYGEPQLFVSLPFGRSLEIVYEDTGDNNRFYSFRIHCSDEEFDNDAFQNTNGILAEETADDFSFDTVFSKLDWAIRIAKETPVEKPLKLEIGDEVTITDATKEQRFCYVVDVLENGVKLFDTTVMATTLITDKSMIKKTGHSEMAYNVFS